MSQGTALQPLCVFGCGRMVMIAGRACWPCQSYEDYLAGPSCPCYHERGCDCVCDQECNVYCAELEYLLYLAEIELDGEQELEASQGRD